IALAMEAKSPSTKVHVVEPEGFDDYGRSLRSGEREHNAKAYGSICDALLSPEPGRLTFAINRARLADGLAVSEAEVKQAMRFDFALFRQLDPPNDNGRSTRLGRGSFGGLHRSVSLIRRRRCRGRLEECLIAGKILEVLRLDGMRLHHGGHGGDALVDV